MASPGSRLLAGHQHGRHRAAAGGSKRTKVYALWCRLLHMEWPQITPRVATLIRRGAQQFLDSDEAWLEELHVATLTGPWMEEVAADPVCHVYGQGGLADSGHPGDGVHDQDVAAGGGGG